MKLPSLRVRAPRNHSAHLFALAVVIVVGVARGQEIKCSPSANKGQPPAFLCGALIRVRRETDCSLTVSEKITFPHTVDTKYQRHVYRLADFQRLSNVRVFLNDSRVRSSLFEDDENSAIIEFETEASTSNKAYTIRYSVSNGALRFSRSCDGTGGRSFPRDNVIRWRSGIFEEGLDEVIVEFESEEEGKLSFVALDSKFESQSASGQIRLLASNVTDEIEAYVRDTGRPLCDEDLICDDSGLGAWIIFLIVAGAILALVSVFIVFFLLRRKKARPAEIQIVDMETTAVDSA